MAAGDDLSKYQDHLCWRQVQSFLPKIFRSPADHGWVRDWTSPTNIRIISSQIIALALIGGGILGVLCIVQRDIKVVIAYSSVVHIALVIAGRLRLTKWGFEGVLVIILAHGVCSSGIFAAANMIYERRHSRRFFFNSGLLNRKAIFRIV